MKWKQDEIDLLEKLTTAGYTDLEISKELNRTVSSVEKKRYESGFIKGHSILKHVNRNKLITQTKEITQLLIDEIAKLKPYTIPKDTVSKHGDTLMIHFADWHVGRIVKDEFGQIKFNVEICKQRVTTLLFEILKLLDANIRRGTPIRDVVIIATGDMVDGQGIFSTQQSMLEIAPPFQVMEAARIIESFIMSLVARKLTVKLYGVRGNHGEVRSNGECTDPNSNWDVMLYLILEYWTKLQKNPNVEIITSYLDFLNFTVQGWRYQIRHKAKSQTETAAGKSQIRGWHQKFKFDAFVFAHVHHWGVWQEGKVTVFRGGSIPGADELSDKMAENSEPCQLIWGVAQDRPLSFFYAIDLGRKIKETRQ